jgi:intracellular septation protein
MKKFFFDLFPIIVFFIAYKLGDSHPDTARAVMNGLGLPLLPNAKPGIYLATLIAIAATFLQIVWVKLRGQKVEPMLWASLVIISVFGGATIWLHDEAFIKWKPTVLYWLFSGVLLVSAMLGKNMIRSIMSGQLELPEPAWSRLNLSWAGFFALMGIINLYVAWNYSTDTWVDFKLFGSMGLMLVFVVIQSVMLSRYLDKEENK